MKRYKKETADRLEIGQVFYTKRFVLTVDRALCKGCVLCKLVCPREAIALRPAPSGPDGRAVAPVVDIDENKCDFHGICAVVCPFSAIKIAVNGQDQLPAVSGEAFPVLTRDIEVDSEKCEPGCKKCEEKCPLGIVRVRFESPAGEPGTVVDVDRELCAGCQICWMECPADAVRVSKFFEGSIRIRHERCPDGCRACLDVCPVDALCLDEGKVYANDTYCIYCGACLNVCPESGALEVTRTAVRHSPVESGAWNKGLEKLTSPAGLDRELAGKRAEKAREAIRKLNASK